MRQLMLLGQKSLCFSGVPILRELAAIIRAVAALNRAIGLTLSWLSLVVVLVCFAVVVQRYFLHQTQIWMQDLYVWLSGAMFTGVAGYALLRDDHVRVDIFYRPASVRRKAMADLFGVVDFLLPFIYVVLHYCYPAVARSWGYYEGSANIGGMPGLFVLKSFIIAFAVLVGLQGIAMAARAILVLGGREDLLPPDLRYKLDDEKEAH